MNFDYSSKVQDLRRRLLDFMSEHGQVFNGNQRPSSAEDRAKLRALYAEALAGA